MAVKTSFTPTFRQPAGPMPRHRFALAAAVLTVAATLALAACAPASAPQLAGKEFVATKVTDGGQDRPLVAGTKLRLSFSASDIGASAGCNHMSGTYRIDGGRLIVADLATTEMGCDPDLMAQDQWLSELLGAGPAVRLVVNDLVLEAGSVSITFVDREVAEPDAKLVGPTWTVESIITGDAVSSVPAEPVATLVFKDDGTLEVNAGCNRGSGTWTSVSGGIEVGPLMLTKMACQGDGASLESAVLGVLEAGTIGAQIDSSLMTLTAGNRGLMLRAS
jgi:heat shock protein HslJ